MLLDSAEAVLALAHPLRLRILGELREGPATSTTLARTLRESTGSTSFHLRQLARYGLIREIPNRGDRRERWWEAVAKGYSAKRPDSPEYRAAAYRLAARVIARDAEIVQAFLGRHSEYPPEWQDAALFTNYVVHVTEDELRALSRKIGEVLHEYSRTDEAKRPSGAKRVYTVIRAVPWDEV